MASSSTTATAAWMKPPRSIGAMRCARSRVHIALGPSNDDAFDGPRRRFVLSPEVAGRLEVSEDDLVELRTGEGPGLRGWVSIDADAGEE